MARPDGCPRCGRNGLAGGKCQAHWSPSVPDPVADTARALAALHRHAEYNARKARSANNAKAEGASMVRAAAIRDAARACGPQVYAAFCALVTGDAGREVGNG